ncbi:ABC transporter permease subunit [Romboutsia lituseburensis]|uniref:ABC transporter permease subunit n=1 Tax=Romboutsia lituseburensis TaxID=1537 RepID=UPI0022EA17F0|nr:ABC transporter permease subunit [Romboutsia lituseburensis]
MNIFRFEFKRLLKSGIVWSLICGFLIVLFMALFPSMEDMGMKEIVNSKMQGMSVDLLKAFNIDAAVDFTNIFDYLGYAIQYIAMASAIYGSILGVNSLIREESQGTIEFLYSKPITRTKIVTSKLLSIVSIFFMYIMIIGILAMGTCYIVKPEDVTVMDLIIKIKSVFIGITLLGFIFMSLGLLISSIIKSDKGAIPISIGIFFVSYFMGMIGKLKESFEWLKYISPFDYFVPSNIMKNGFEIKYIIISLCIIVICVISSYAIYKNKDMNI